MSAGRMGPRRSTSRPTCPRSPTARACSPTSARVIADAWASFDRPRAEPDPELDGELAERLRAPLPEDAGDAEAALADAARVLDASVSPSRPLFLAYIGSTGLEIGVLASRARRHLRREPRHDARAAPTSSRSRRCAGWRTSSASRSPRARSPAAA